MQKISQSPLVSQQVIKGYTILDLIDEGGFGAIYRAHQEVVGREVAIKVILPRYANSPNFIRRFEAEAQLVARLEHLHIVPLYDYWRDPDGAYLVMRWLRGGSVSDSLAAEGAWTLNRSSRLLEQVASALATAHQSGVVHRDLKPGNILLDEQGNAYLADFGIALYHQDEDADEDSMIGSPAYISPEQITGDTVTPLSDQYSLGIVMFQLLAGKQPYTSEQSAHSLLISHLQVELPSLRELRPDLPPGIDDVLRRATAKKPGERFPDVLEFASEFYRVAFTTASPVRASEDTNIILPELKNPYKGLRAFREADAANFFGREHLVSRLIERLRDDASGRNANFIALVGPSGSGKSSVVSAGVFPELRRGIIPGSQHWFLVEMFPGSDPMRELETALLRIATNRPESLLNQLRENDRGLIRALKRVLPQDDEIRLMLFINQFEEVFTQVEDEAARELFLMSLLNAVNEPGGRLKVIITMRADFYDRPLHYADFGRLVREQTEVVLPLSPEELESTIMGPAERVGLELEAGLVASIVEDVRRQPGALPLLQYALTELFERRMNRTLTLDAYQAIGGVSGALVQRAEDVFDDMDKIHQAVTRQLFLRLVTLGEGTEDTRRRAYQAELFTLTEDKNIIQNLLNTFGKYRLVTFDHDPATREPTVQIAHEALIHRWKRFNNWLNDSREELQLQRRLSSTVEDWINAERDPSFLATGMRLQQFEAWSNQTELALTQDEMNYLNQSIIQREEQHTAEAKRKAREESLERRSRRALRALVSVMFVATIVAIGLAALAFFQRQDAQEARSIAESEAERAENSALIARRNAEEAERNASRVQSLAWASSSQLVLSDNNNDLAIALGLQATTRLIKPPPEAQRALAAAAYSPGTRHVFTGHTSDVPALVVSPDGKIAVSGGLDLQLIVWDLQKQQEIERLHGHGFAIRSLAMNPDGNIIYSGDDSGTLVRTDLISGEQIILRDAQPAAILDIDVSADGARLVSSDADGNIIIRNADTLELIRTLHSTGGAVRAVLFARNGTSIYSGADSGIITRWDSESGELADRYEAHAGAVYDLAISPGGGEMLSASADHSVLYWNLRSGAVLERLNGHADSVYAVAFNLDEHTAFSGSQDGSIIEWRLDNGTEVQRFEGHTGAVTALSFIPGTGRILSSSSDNNLRLWDTLHGLQLQRFDAHQGEIFAVAYSPDGRTALTGGADRAMYLWDVINGRLLKRIYGHADAIRAIAFLPDGKRAVSASDDMHVLLWNLETGEVLHRFDGHTGRVRAVAISPDGKTMISGGNDNVAIVWDIQSGAELMRFEGHDNWIRDVAISPDGKTALTGSADTTIILWSLETGEIIHRLSGHTDWVWQVAYSTDGKMAVSSGSDGRVLVWNLETGELLRQIEGHSGPVYTIGFTPDSSAIISGSADRTLRIWDMATGAEISRFTGHTAGVFDLAVEVYGRYMLSVSGDGTMRKWQIPYSFNNVVEWTFANRYVRELTCVERSAYRVTPLCGQG